MATAAEQVVDMPTAQEGPQGTPGMDASAQLSREEMARLRGEYARLVSGKEDFKPSIVGKVKSVGYGSLICLGGVFVGGPILLAELISRLGLFGRQTVARRHLKVLSTVIKVYMDYHLTNLYSNQRYGPDDTSPKCLALWSRVHSRNARRVYDMIEKVEGILVKVGQFASSRADVMPDEYIQVLSKCEDGLPARPEKETRQTLTEQLGDVDAIFSSFEWEPIACASIAQVHVAYLKSTGEKVAVKVQHKYAAVRAEQDLKLLGQLLNLLGRLEPQFDMRPILSEFLREIPKELDFHRESSNGQRVERSLDHCRRLRHDDPSGMYVRAKFPQIKQDLLSAKVLVMSFEEGFKVTDLAKLEEHKVDREELMRNIARAFGNQVFIDGFFQADPHPGNILVAVDETDGSAYPILLDFGLTKEISDDIRLAFATMMLAAKDSNLGELLNALEGVGMKMNATADRFMSRIMESAQFFFRTSRPTEEAKLEMGIQRMKAMKMLQEEVRMQADKSLRRSPLDAFPDQLIFLSRTLYLIRGLASRLGVRQNYIELLLPFAVEALLQATTVPENPSPWVSHDGSVALEVDALDGSEGGEKALAQDVVVVIPKHSRARQPMSLIREPQLAYKDHGVVHSPELQKSMLGLLERLIGSEDEPILGVQVAVFYEGRCVVDIVGGQCGPYDAGLVTHDTQFNIFSISKSLVAACAHYAVHEGILVLDEPVAYYWPEFGQNGKDMITVRDLLGHRAGMAFNGLTCLFKNPFDVCDWEKMVRVFESERPVSTPSQTTQYHILAYGWLVGALLEKVYKMPLDKIVSNTLSQPLDLAEQISLGVDESKMSQLPFSRSGNLASVRLPKEETNEALRDARQRLSNGSTEGVMRQPSNVGRVPDEMKTVLEELRTAQGGGEGYREGDSQGDNALMNALSHTSVLAMPELFNAKRVRAAWIPAGNMHATAYAVAKVYSCMVCSTGSDDKCSDFSAAFGSNFQEEMTRVFADEKYEDDAAALSLGFWVYRACHNGTLRYQFGHGGLGGAFAFCDPHSQVACCVLVNKLTMKRRAATEVVRLCCGHFGIPVPFPLRETTSKTTSDFVL